MNGECEEGLGSKTHGIFFMLGMWNLASALMIVDMEKTQIGSKDTLNFRSSLLT